MYIPFIGIDVGRSAVKAVARQGGRTFTLSFPAAVAPAQEVFGDNAAKAEAETVQVAGESFWTGETAIGEAWGREPVGRSDDWVADVSHDALVASAMNRLIGQGLVYEGSALVTLGVPSRVFRGRRDLVDGIKKRVRRLLQRPEGGELEVFVHAQPMGVVTAHTLDDEGFVKEGSALDEGSYAVVEVGQYTTDFTAVVRGSPVMTATTSCEGVELIVNHVRQALRERAISLPNPDLERWISNRSIRVRGESVDISALLREGIQDVFVPKVLNSLRQVFPPALLETVDMILVAGGGAPIIIDALTKAPATSHAVMVKAPRMAVADGFAKMSAMFHQLAQPEAADQAVAP